MYSTVVTTLDLHHARNAEIVRDAELRRSQAEHLAAHGIAPVATTTQSLTAAFTGWIRSHLPVRHVVRPL